MPTTLRYPLIACLQTVREMGLLSLEEQRKGEGSHGSHGSGSSGDQQQPEEPGGEGEAAAPEGRQAGASSSTGAARAGLGSNANSSESMTLSSLSSMDALGSLDIAEDDAGPDPEEPAAGTAGGQEEGQQQGEADAEKAERQWQYARTQASYCYGRMIAACHKARWAAAGAGLVCLVDANGASSVPLSARSLVGSPC